MSMVRLEQENTQLKAALFSQEKQLSAKEKRITQLEELLRGFTQKTFGSSSEQSPRQGQLFDEAEQGEFETELIDDTLTVPAHTRQKKRRISIPAEIPREEIIYDVTDEQKICPKDGTTLQQIG